MENVQNFLKSLFCANLITKSHNQGVKEQGLAEDVRESPSYPGMKSYYRIHVVDCNITIEDDEDLQEEFQITEGETEPFQVRELTGDKHVFEWVDEKKAREEYKVFLDIEKANVDSSASIFENLGLPKFAADNDWSADMLKAMLESYKVELPANAADLEPLVAELKACDICLVENSSVGQLVAVQTVLKAKESEDGGVVRTYENALTAGKRLGLPAEKQEHSWKHVAHTAVPALQVVMRQVT
eukprot:gene191-301_t